MTHKEHLPEGDLSNETLESFLEGRVMLAEMTEVFAGLSTLRSLVQGPLTFDIIEQYAHLFGSFGANIQERVQNYRSYFYGGERPEPVNEASYAEQEITHLYQGKRPGIEEFQAMQAAWDQAEERELAYLMYSAFNKKYRPNFESGEGIYMEFSDVDDTDFSEPVLMALQGKVVRATEIETRLVNGPESTWYAIDRIDFSITDREG